MIVKGVGLLCLLLGALTVMNPKMWWEIMENWKKYPGEEPSEKWMRMTKISGWVYVIVGLAVIL